MKQLTWRSALVPASAFEGAVLTDLILREIQDRVLVMPRIEVSELKNRASLIGGIQYLIDHTDLLAEL
mgnify:CR=1 FL=1